MKHTKLRLLAVFSSLFLISAISLATLLNHPTPASASTTTFNIAAGSDSIAIGDGCRLSEAIVNINNSAQTHADCPAGVSNPSDINVISLPADTVTLTTDLPLITKPTNIIGQGKSVSVVDGGGLAYSIFRIVVIDNVDNRSLDYKDFTLQNADYDNQNDRCLAVILDSPNSSTSIENVDARDCGMQTFDLGTVDMFDDVPDNTEGSSISIVGVNISRSRDDFRTNNGGTGWSGVAINGGSNVTIRDSTFQGNIVGIIDVTTSGIPKTFSMSNTTVSENIVALAFRPSSDFAAPGEVWNTDVHLTNNTIYANLPNGVEDFYGGSAIDVRGPNEDSEGDGVLVLNMSLQNNIIANNEKNPNVTSSVNCSDKWKTDLTITSLGNNLSDNGCLTSFGPNDILSSDIDSTISALADNGGAVKTLALKAGSPAIDTAATVDSITTDARGFLRPFGVAYDIGAYEYGSTDPNPPETPPPNPPKTGRIAIAIVLTTVILSSVLLLARAYEKKYHVGTGEK